MKLEVTKQESDLRKLVWSFWVQNQKIILDSFHIEFKETPKHRWKIARKGIYNRIDKRNTDLKESDVQLPDDVKYQAIQKLISQIEVLKWSEYKSY